MGSDLGIPNEKLLALDDWAASALFDETEHLALAYADAISFTDRDVDDDLFARLRAAFTDDALVELTATIAWENASSKFNRALRMASQGLWQGTILLQRAESLVTWEGNATRGPYVDRDGTSCQSALVPPQVVACVHPPNPAREGLP